MRPLEAGKLRHRIQILEQSRTQDPITGSTTTVWTPVDTVWAAIEPLSARDFIAAQTLKSRVSVRITMRYRSGINTSMRLIGPDGTAYIPEGFLADPNSGREYITVPCSVTS